MIDFQCEAFGKCILVGEHSVLRGVPSLVVPLKSRSLHLQYEKKSAPLELILKGDHGVDLKALVESVLLKAYELKGISRDSLQGRLTLESAVPVGAGMGASATLCVALTRWLGFLGYVQESEYYEFARQLENLFHGESSGVDIAVALTGEGLRFLRYGDRKPLQMNWQPRWYISYSGKRGVTVDAVNKVKAFIAKDPVFGAQVDEQMAQAVVKAEYALAQNAQDGFPLLVEAIELGAKCFEQWDLIAGEPAEHMAWLKKSGANAVKPTGSGGGGYVLSLWKNSPPADVLEKLIPC
jgi:mevalonate kinase